ncbi:MAG: hypothetical protein JHD02_03690 [Thermoleophilaceae bacterium]|nr:hypothetical protein [Thermoleophilaceae bacterium]
MVRTLDPYQDWNTLELTCSYCGWKGLGSDSTGFEVFEDHSVIECPNCFRSLAYIPHLRAGEAGVREAEKYGTEEDVAAAKKRAERYEHVTKTRDSITDDLPELNLESFAVTWDQKPAAGEDADQGRDEGEWDWVLSVDDREIWREPRCFEDFERFAEVVQILKAKYGEAVTDLSPTEASLLYLLGDAVRAHKVLAQARAKLSSPDQHDTDQQQASTRTRGQSTRRPKPDPTYNASEDPSWAQFDDRIPEDTVEGRVTTWLGLPQDADDPEDDCVNPDEDKTRGA